MPFISRHPQIYLAGSLNMRLLNTSSLELREFMGGQTPPYAILSHTWGEGEVLFEDIRTNTAPSKKGHHKITGCCKKARDDEYEWVWIDTCCIDKSSSAELSEAINSMYQWYKDSAVCYAYLEDVVSKQTSLEPGLYDIRNFTAGRWFTRGWTLQELIAPSTVEFYTNEWVEIGSKASLSAHLADATHIGQSVLLSGDLSTSNVAERMSWAANRITTREEDMSYCLLGLFGINMPLLYGEGSRAFFRLQEQILKQEEDYSIFAWCLQESPGRDLSGLLASSPKSFSKLHTVYTEDPHEQYRPLTLSWSKKTTFPWYELHRNIDYSPLQDAPDIGQSTERSLVVSRPPELTSRGLKIVLPVLEARDPMLPYIVFLYKQYRPTGYLVCIMLQSIPQVAQSTLEYNPLYSQLRGRASSHQLVTIAPAFAKDFILKEMLVRLDGVDGKVYLPWRSLDFKHPSTIHVVLTSKLATSLQTRYTSSIVSGWPRGNWAGSTFRAGYDAEPIGCLLVESTSPGDARILRYTVYIGACYNRWWCHIVHPAPDVLGQIDGFRKLFSKDLEAFARNWPSKLSERAAFRHVLAEGIVFHAVVRRKPQHSHFVHTLHIGTCTHDERPPWASMLLAL